MAEENEISIALELSKHFWEEFKYRHDLIWQRVFRFTAAIVLLSIIPYSQQEIALAFGNVILIAPVLAALLAILARVVMRNELFLFEKIATAYWQQQNKLLDNHLKHNLTGKRPFSKFVGWYLNCLILLSSVNILIVWFLWIPQLFTYDTP